MKKANIDELTVSDVRPGVTRRSFSGAGATLAWGTLSPGHEPRPHTHPHEQIVYIVSGHGQFTVGDETAEVTAGDMLVVPSGVLDAGRIRGQARLGRPAADDVPYVRDPGS